MVNPSASTALRMVLNLHPAWALTVWASLSMSMRAFMSDMSTRTSPSVWLPFLLRGEMDAPADMTAETALARSSALAGLMTVFPSTSETLEFPMREQMCSTVSAEKLADSAFPFMIRPPQSRLWLN